VTAIPTPGLLARHFTAVVAVVGFGLPSADGQADIRCTLADKSINESSGIASASWSDDVVFTHNDSGDAARFFAVDARTCATTATFTVAGASNVDWEDMARSAAADGTPVLWLADIGDNGGNRRGVVIYEVNEPAPGATGTVAIRSRWALTYPDGAHDAETLLVDPETGRPVIVTKDVTAGMSRAYRVRSSGSGVLEPLAALDVRALPGGGLASPAWSLTGGATGYDRRHLVLRSYFAGWLWATSPGEPLATTLARPPQTIDLPLGRQAEALSFSRDDGGIWGTSEGVGSPLFLAPLPQPGERSPGATAVPAPGPSGPRSPARDRTTIAIALVGAGSALLLGCSVVLLVGLARRRRLA